jgi:RNA polymerase sigma factor (sigma-70 family)
MRDAEFERLYAAHAEGLFAFLAYRTGDRARAEDILADTFERVLRARRGFDRRRGSERTWLYTIALNVLRDHLRRAGAEERALERATAPDDAAADPRDAVHSRDALQRALEALSAEEREVIALRFGGDLSLKEMARVAGEPETTVEGRLYRALRKLRKAGILSPLDAE